MNAPVPQDNWQARALTLVQRIDQVRDSLLTQEEMLTQFVTLLAEAVQAEVCVLAVRDEDSGELQLRALLDRAAVFESATAAELRQLMQKAGTLGNTEILDAQFALPNGQPAFGLAAPLHLGEIPLGALLVLNAAAPFSAENRQLILHAIGQMDSALQHARVLVQLRQRQKELETIYRIDRIRDRGLDFASMMDAVLSEVCRAIFAEAGFIMLFDKGGQALELRATTDAGLFNQSEVLALVRNVSEAALNQSLSVHRTYQGRAVRAILGMPLILREKRIGVLGVINREGHPAFTRADVNLLSAIASQIDTAIFENLQTQRLRNAFGRCVGPKVMERLITISDRDLLTSERRVVTTLFSDIRGFTSMSQQIPAEQLQQVLNDHLSALSGLVLDYEGTLDKYIGDCVMCFFNAPERQADHALRAVRLALDMHQAHHEVMARWQDRLPLPPIGIGISTGETMMGNFGSERRLEYTAIGRDVNLAARLCGAALADQTLISEATYNLVRDAVHAERVDGQHLKGIEGDVVSWNVVGLK